MITALGIQTEDTVAGTVLAITLPSNLRNVQIKTRSGNGFLLAFLSTADGGIPASGVGTSTNEYQTIEDGEAWEQDNLDYSKEFPIWVRTVAAEIMVIEYGARDIIPI